MDVYHTPEWILILKIIQVISLIANTVGLDFHDYFKLLVMCTSKNSFVMLEGMYVFL